MICPSHYLPLQLITHFQFQVPHPPVRTPAETPSTIGPGSYLNASYMPDQLSGGSVAAGHDAHLRHTMDFSRQATRPGSAPPSSVRNNRPLSAASHRNVKKSRAEEAAKALGAMYDTRLGPADRYIGLQALQELGDRSAGRRRPQTAAASPAGARGGVIEEVDEEALEWYGEGHGTEASRLTGVSYLGPEELLRFSSTGFSKRVAGGRISQTSRATVTMGL